MGGMGADIDPWLQDEGIYARFVASLNDYAVVIIDAQGRVASWNPAASTITGYSPDEIIGKPFEIFYTTEAKTVGHPERELNAAAATGRYEEEGWRVRKDGSRLWASIAITPLYDDEGVLRGYGKVVRDLTERKQAEEQQTNVMKLLEATASTDFLTGLPNRRAWDEGIARALAFAGRHERPLSVAMIDLDNFKDFNDEHGHKAGDRFMKQAVGAWRDTLRAEDLLARYGGEEFTVLMPECTEDDAIRVLERLRRKTPTGATCSIGVAEWDREESEDSLIGRADRALYASKAAGRDRLTSSYGTSGTLRALPGHP
jgi:diguanylate cyclase (GGDEF)-like protein/PAS domain S-box-containing protein